MGPANDGRRYLLNVQPVIPISLNAEWNLISRTIVPLIDQNDVFPGEGSRTMILLGAAKVSDLRDRAM